MPCEVSITTGSRLHFGLLANEPKSGRNFGGVGLMLAQPGYVLTFTSANEDSVVASPGVRSRVEQLVARYRARCLAESRPLSCRIEVPREIPPHIGLGSGTQLGLAVARGLAWLAGDDATDLLELARRVGRGERSALGFHGFRLGGLLVEGGKLRREAISPLVTRVDFPSEWRLVLITPPETVGLSGAEESSAFARLPPMDAATTGQLCAITLMRLLPAVVEGDCHTCGEAIYDFGRIVGTYFAPAQGGVYASRRMSLLVEQLRSDGIRGVGQSSWGPTIFALCPDTNTAEQLVRDLQSSCWQDCTIQIAAAMNHGATAAVS